MPTLFKLWADLSNLIIDHEVTLKDNKGMKPKDVSLAVSILEENKELILEEWNKLHGL